MTSDLDKLLERAVLHTKHGTSGMCVAPQEIVGLIALAKWAKEHAKPALKEAGECGAICSVCYDVAEKALAAFPKEEK